MNSIRKGPFPSLGSPVNRQKRSQEALWAWEELYSQAECEGAVALGNPKVAMKTSALMGSSWTQLLLSVLHSLVRPGLRQPFPLSFEKTQDQTA